MIFKLSLFFILCSLYSTNAQENLEECIIRGDPQVIEFHPVSQTPRRSKMCLGAHIANAINNAFSTLRVDVSNNHYMVQLDFQFRTPPSQSPFCLISSYNFTISLLGNCAAGGRRHFNMQVWMPSSVVSNDQGICHTSGCTGSSGSLGKRSVRSLQNIIDNATNLSNETAFRICDAYIQAYLDALTRLPSQRDVHYNGTIDIAYETCVFDVVTVGAGMAASVLEMLLIEEQTTGVTNLSNIVAAIQNNLDAALTVMEQVVENITMEIVAILNDYNTTSTQRTTSNTYIVARNLSTSSVSITNNGSSATMALTSTIPSNGNENIYKFHFIVFLMLTLNRRLSFLKLFGVY